ncbi:hypothetical protein RZS08_00500, partial [Arthrospira platensis SPKY1]|nr:hypothetical protein [Arthrospira platensis SPKY1]
MIIGNQYLSLQCHARIGSCYAASTSFWVRTFPASNKNRNKKTARRLLGVRRAGVQAIIGCQNFRKLLTV